MIDISPNQITLKYEIQNNKEKSIKIFGNEFVENNKENCKIIIHEIEYPLTSEINKNILSINNNCFEIILSGINQITDLSYLFNGCENILSLPDISLINTKNINNISCMFDGCKLIKTIPDISKWDTSNITNMFGLFHYRKLNTIPDISKWNVKKVTNMSEMFYAFSLDSEFPDISKWNTNNLNDISKMFAYCGLKKIPNLSNWNTKNLKNIKNLFYCCEKIK